MAASSWSALRPLRAQDRLSQPLQAEDQQEDADDQAQGVDGTSGQRGPERGDDRGERDQAAPPRRSAPTATRA